MKKCVICRNEILHENQDMCYVRVELRNGFFYKDGTGYKVDFAVKEAEESPFEFDIVHVV